VSFIGQPWQQWAESDSFAVSRLLRDRMLALRTAQVPGPLPGTASAEEGGRRLQAGTQRRKMMIVRLKQDAMLAAVTVCSGNTQEAVS